MAFFGLTKLGYQDPIREHVFDPKITPISAFRSGEYRDPNFRLPKTIEKCDTAAAGGKEHHMPDAATPFTGQTVGYNRGSCASHEELMRMRQKHIVNPTGSYLCDQIVLSSFFLYFVHLGVVIDSDLKVSSQCMQAYGKANWILGMITRTPRMIHFPRHLPSSIGNVYTFV